MKIVALPIPINMLQQKGKVEQEVEQEIEQEIEQGEEAELNEESNEKNILVELSRLQVEQYIIKKKKEIYFRDKQVKLGGFR
jgi:predicted solute-binding protein